MAAFKGEQLVKTLQTKKIYNYIDTDKKIDQLSREVFTNKKLIIHYPRGFDGGPKYKTIKSFHFIGFKKEKDFPVGIFKSENYGWGFTRTLNPFAEYLDNNFDFEEVIIEKEGKLLADVEKKRLYLNESSLIQLNQAFKSIFSKHKAEIDFTVKVNGHSLFPDVIDKPEKTYVSDALANSLASWGNDIEEFSDADKNAIKDLFDKLSVGTDFLSDEALAKTKELIDSKYIQSILKKYKELMALKTDGESLEKQWQFFLKENNWIFSSIFAQPVILFQREAYVGGKTIDNQNGKFNDFLIKNSLSDNVSFLEIKTHKTKLLEKIPYRGDDVFSATKDLTGCIVQVLNQRDNFQKEFYAVKGKTKTKGNFETFNSKCVVLIGSTKDLDENQKYAFELFRSNSRDVEILTFDELQLKIESLQKILSAKK